MPFAGALQPAPAGISGNVTCSNLALGAVAVDSVIVPAHAACQLRGTRLNGSIVVNTGAVLDAADVSVIGNLQADGAARCSPPATASTATCRRSATAAASR